MPINNQLEVVRDVEELLSLVRIVPLSSEELMTLKQRVQAMTRALKSSYGTPSVSTEALSDVQEARSQIGGTHYLTLKMDPWSIIDALDLDFYEGSALKYLLRYKNKDGVLDLKKLRHYVDKMEENYVANRKAPEERVRRTLAGPSPTT